MIRCLLHAAIRHSEAQRRRVGCARVAKRVAMSCRISVQPNHLGNKAVSRLFTRGRRSACKPRSMAGAVASPEQLLKVYDYDDLSESDTTELIQRPRIDFSAILDTVRCPGSLL